MRIQVPVLLSMGVLRCSASPRAFPVMRGGYGGCCEHLSIHLVYVVGRVGTGARMAKNAPSRPFALIRHPARQRWMREAGFARLAQA